MKKRFLVAAVCCAALVGLLLIGSLTGGLRFYNTPSSANEPAIKAGDKILVSNLKSPKRFSFICYEANSDFFGRGKFISRLCGLPGDKVQIKEGVLYINDINVDQGLNLKNQYTIATKEIELLSLEEDDYTLVTSDTAIAAVETGVLKAKKLNLKRRILPETEEVPEIKKAFSKNWNVDHFGPVEVPEAHYFVLGDNRYGSLDSRFLGFISSADFVGTVLWR